MGSWRRNLGQTQGFGVWSGEDLHIGALGATDTPVSYTHLDVYKRQQDDCVRKNPFNFKLSEIIENDTKEKVALTEEPVSYTHLDVYKRQFIGIALSNFTRLPCLNRLRAVLFHVSFITSTVKDCRGKQVTVRQIPVTAMLSPKCISCLLYTSRCV